MPCQDIVDAPLAPVLDKAPRPTTFGEWIRIMQTAYSDRPAYPQMELLSMEEEFINLANDIDVCTERFMELQTTMTKDAALDTHQGCRLVGMHAHQLAKLVNAAREIGLTVPQVEFLQQRVPDLSYMEKVMWEAIQETEPHLYDILKPESLAMVNHVHDNTENHPMSPPLEVYPLTQPIHEESGPVEPYPGEFSVDDEFIYLMEDIAEVTHNFMRIQMTMTTALDRYTRCLVLSDRISDLQNEVLAAQHIGFNPQQMAYIESMNPNLVYMEKVLWEQSVEIQPHLPNIFESMGNEYCKSLQ